ncbi:F-box/kelch-repeat protein At3g06240-like [Prunus avium]|uniref:F-box/kelch-repeat protein At3g06240-like n=1 Tax=Prunus avium TaxID=42229 RepID=A0A6P5U3K1_PRUAV|nr:F-box/kelch-repeat protein At3g06240-like [Prunus avium]
MDTIQDITQGMHELNFEATAAHPFPEEIIQEILIRLPVKSLIKCTSVCKTWRSMIINQTLIRAHLSPQNDIDSHLLLVHRYSVSSTEETIFFRNMALSKYEVIEVVTVHYDNQAFDEYSSKIEFPVAVQEKTCDSCNRVAGICDGLVCLVDDADDIFGYNYNLFIWNPSIRKFVTLPEPGVKLNTHGEYRASIGFGFDATTNDYKTNDYHHPYDSILAFDLGKEVFHEIFMPEGIEWNCGVSSRLSISGDRKSIALFKVDNRNGDCILDIWVMKEYGRTESWTKLMTLGRQGPERLLPRDPLCFRKSGELVLLLTHTDDKSRNELVSLNLASKQVKNLGIDGYRCCDVAIRKLVTLPKPSVRLKTHREYDASIGFGFDARTNDYKVVRVVSLPEEPGTPTLAEVYSLATGTWSSLGRVSPSCLVTARATSNVFLNGVLHWPVDCRTNSGDLCSFILAFDLGKEVFSKIFMPKVIQRNFGCDEDCFLDIWVMKEYGRKESWTRLITLGPQGPERFLPTGPICFRKSGEVLLLVTSGTDKSRKELASLDLVSKQLKKLGISGYQSSDGDFYKESLLLLDKTDAESY